MKKLLGVLACILFAGAMIASAADTQTVNGWITDSKCGAKGANAKAEACTKKCLEGGDQKVLMVENPDALKGHEGHHVAVTGHVTGDTIHVESAKML